MLAAPTAAAPHRQMGARVPICHAVQLLLQVLQQYDLFLAGTRNDDPRVRQERSECPQMGFALCISSNDSSV